MGIPNEVVQESTTTIESNPTPVSTPSPTPGPTPDVPPPAGATPPVASTPPGYTPNFKYKVLNEEKEFDPFIRDVIKDAEIEKKVRELYERADGIDFVKRERDRFRQEHSEYRKQVDPVIKELRQAGMFLQQGDLEKFFSIFNLSEDLLVKYVTERLQYKQLPPEQRAQADALRKQRDAYYEQTSEAEILREQNAQLQIQQVNFELGILLERPEVKTVVSNFDARAGKPGAFLEKFEKYADYLCSAERRFVPPSEAMKSFLDLLGNSYSQPQPEAQQAPAQAPAVVAPPSQKPSVRTFPAQGTAPVKKGYRSLQDLRKKYDELSGRATEAGQR